MNVDVCNIQTEYYSILTIHKHIIFPFHRDMHVVMLELEILFELDLQPNRMPSLHQKQISINKQVMIDHSTWLANG